jgi:hypothetical protein
MDRDEDDVVAEYLQIFEELESKSLTGGDFDAAVAKIADSFA